MWKFIALLLLAFASVGCVDDTCKPEYGTCSTDLSEDQRDDWHGDNLKATLTVDPTLTEVEMEAVFAAADTWRVATEGKLDVKFEIADGPLPTHYIVRRARKGEFPKGMLAAATDTRIKLSEGLGDNKYLHQSLVHEFGHYFGLGHEPDLFDDIMYPVVHEGMASKPTSDALGDLKVLYGW